MVSFKSRLSSVKSLRYCCFVLCWSVLLLTTVCIFGGSQTNFLYDYATDPQAAVFYSTTTTTENPLPLASQLELLLSKPKDSRNLFMEMVRNIEKSVPSLPLDFWARQTMIGKNRGESECANLPSILELEYSNDYWQTQRTSNGTFQLFGAYLDNRKTIPGGDQFVRILGMIDRKEMANQLLYCQIWYDQMDKSFIVPVDSYKYIWVSGWGNAIDGEYQPYLISCRLPPEMRDTVPASVSLVENKCDLATNSLRVIYNKPINRENRQKFAVCVKGLDFLYEDLSVRLVEWIELLSILGANKIYFYDLQMHPNIRKVLDYYERRGKVEVSKITLPAGKPNFPGLQHLYLKDRITQKRQHEIIPYNDCLYKNMYRYEYVTLLDIDEVIMPKGNLSSWSQLMDVVEKKAAVAITESDVKFYPSFDFRNSYFLDRFYRKGLAASAQYNSDIPQFLHMLRHTSRSQNFSQQGDHAKCFHRTDSVLTVHNHFALDCLSESGYCNTFDVDVADGQLQHYRKDCVTSSERNCTIAKTFVEDRSIYKYKSKLIRRSLSALIELGFVRRTMPRINAKTLV